MENNQNSNPAFDIGSQSSDRKKLLIIGAIVIFVILIAVVSLFLSSGSQGPNGSRPGTDSSNSAPRGSSNLTPVKSPVTSQSPASAAKSFYNWYISHPSPIKSGAYELREDTTAEFKEVMAVFLSRGIDPGYDHVFCEISSLPKNVTLAEPTYSEDRTVALIMFKDVVSGRDLFQMKLENVHSKWLVADVWCPPVQRPEI